MTTNFHALPVHGGWALRRSGGRRALRRFETQAEAWREARRRARAAGTTAYLHGTDGLIKVRAPHKPPTAEQPAAIITIKAAPRMSSQGRAQIAAWLRRHADMLVKEGKNYTHGRFTGRYLYA